MKRKRFPVRPGFALTANKAQGQTLSHVGISFHMGNSMSQKTALKSIPAMKYIPAMWFTMKSCIKEQGKLYYDFIVAFIEGVLYFVVFGSKGILIIFGIFQAYETQRVKLKQVNDSRSLKLDCQVKIRLKIQRPKDQSPPFRAITV
ncbi:hypothetical protein RRG08_031988 [Elysia crispata]|uniref:ATP-dependent DNA helicase n=1 Tax=Elysia crispata TaxID=231223 RepID=A0AAE0YC87_9GAST|nr:hypothetical protein RRG08_031988 [Elysia crispata]